MRGVDSRETVTAAWIRPVSSHRLVKRDGAGVPWRRASQMIRTVALGPLRPRSKEDLRSPSSVRCSADSKRPGSVKRQVHVRGALLELTQIG